MNPVFYEVFEGAAYPCYWLGANGVFWMNQHARGKTGEKHKKMRSALVAALERQHLSGAGKVQMMPANTANIRGFTLVPVAGGMLALGTVAEANFALPFFSAEVRESLSNIFSALPVVAKKLDGPDVRYIEEMQNQCYKLLRLFSNLETLQKQETHAGSLPVLDFTALLDSVAVGFEGVSQYRGIPFKTALPKKPVFIHGNKILIEDAVLNILRNSLQYTRDGNNILLKLYEAAGRAVLTIEDRGLGIKQEFLPYIFDMYFSQDPYGDSPERPGAGLGLAVAQNAVQNAGGVITAESTFGAGTRISLSFPLAQNTEDVLGSDSAVYLRNRYSPLYVQLCGFCPYPDMV